MNWNDIESQRNENQYFLPYKRCEKFLLSHYARVKRAKQQVFMKSKMTWENEDSAEFM